MPLLDFKEGKRPSRFRLKPSKAFIALGSVCSLVFGYTFAANINLNDNQAVEFGQGMVQTVVCDQDGLILTPYSDFINGDSNFTPISLTADSVGLTSGRLLNTSANMTSIRVGDSVTGSGIPADSFITNITGAYFAINNSYIEEITSRTLTISRPPGRFLLNAIELADIDAVNCANKALTIKVYNSTSSSSLATYEVFSIGYEVTSASGQIEISVSEGEATMFLTIEEPTVAATDVYRITIESKDLTYLDLNRIGVWPGSLYCQAFDLEDCLIPTSSSGDSQFYCSGSECNVVFLAASDFLGLVIEECQGENIAECALLSQVTSWTWSLSENNTDDPDMPMQILISGSGLVPVSLHLDGRILYSNAQYAVFRWFRNTGDVPTPENPIVQRSYSDLIISFSDSLPITTPYDGESGLPFDAPLYELSWTY